jgi:hypothetical protein
MYRQTGRTRTETRDETERRYKDKENQYRNKGGQEKKEKPRGKMLKRQRKDGKEE